MKYTQKAPINDWLERAACASTDPDLFTSKSPSCVAKAKDICKRCPVIEDCLEHAIDNGMSSGIWGGMTPTERTRLRRSRLNRS